MIGMPGHVQVGATRYSVALENMSRKHLGRTRRQLSSIEISSAQSADSARETTLHESLHALLWSTGTAAALDLDEEAEERLIQVLSPALLCLLRDNPELVAYLTDKD